MHTEETRILLSWLKAEREAAGLSMRDLGDRLSKPHSFVQKVESGERRLDVVEYVWYCDALGVSPSQGLVLLAKEKGVKSAAGKKW